MNVARIHVQMPGNRLSFWLVRSSVHALESTWHSRMCYNLTAWFGTVNCGPLNIERMMCMEAREKSPFITKSVEANSRRKCTAQAQPFHTIQKLFAHRLLYACISFASEQHKRIVARTRAFCIDLFVAIWNHNFCRFRLFRANFGFFTAFRL